MRLQELTRLLSNPTTVGLGEAAEVSGKRGKTASLLGSGGLVDLTLVTDVKQVQENLMKKEVRSKTLSPGSSVYGFVYVPVPTDAPRKKMHLQVPLTNAQSAAGNTPLNVTVMAGKHEISIKKAGYSDWNKNLDVSGSTAHVEAVLEVPPAQ